MKIKNVQLVFDGDHTESLIDLGAVTLSRNGRENQYDICDSRRDFDGEQTTIECELASGNDIFPDCPYDLEEVDFASDELKAEVYVANGDDDDFPMDDFEHATLFVKFTGGMVKAIDLKLEN